MLTILSGKLGEEHRVTFTCSEYALKSLTKVLSACHTLGSVGASRSVEFDFDGDGSAKIGEVEVDGIPLKEWMAKNHPSFKCDYDRDSVKV